MNQSQESCIGIFDSGVGGVSVLKELVKELPFENFYYYSDALHAPYGIKDSSWIANRSRAIVDQMITKGAKAIVIACNTATSAAAATLRKEFENLPIIGVEPALKPAVKRYKTIMVMATPVTLRLDKYQDLAARWSSEARVINVPCLGLADRIEQGNLNDKDIYTLVNDLICNHAGEVEAVVLGCTHYVFVKDVIKSILGDVAFFDGGEGTARELHRQLEKRNLLNKSHNKGTIIFDSSSDDPKHFQLLQTLFNHPYET